MGLLAPNRIATGSRAPIIVYGKLDAVTRLYQECRGEREPEDLSRNYAVQQGRELETFNINWTEHTLSRKLTRRQEHVPHPTLPGISCTLDAFDEQEKAPVEFKSLSAFAKPENTGDQFGYLTWYSAQLATQMACTQSTRGFLAIQQDKTAPQLFEPNIDEAYIAGVIERLAAFVICVQTGTPPGPLPPEPVLPEKWRTVDLDAIDTAGENWLQPMRDILDHWSMTRGVWREHEEAKKEIKELLPPDVGRVTYQGKIIRRSRSNAITTSEAA